MSKQTNEYMKHFFPDSIAAKYIEKLGRKHFDHDLLMKIIDGPEYESYERPKDNEMVVHLRLGDSMRLRSDEEFKRAAQMALKHGFDSVVLVTEHVAKQQVEAGTRNHQVAAY